MNLKIRSNIFLLLVLLLFAIVLSNCSGIYFRKADQPPPILKPRFLSERTKFEYWTGIVFNGAKIGFSHFVLSPATENAGWFDIKSEAYFRVRFLLFDKKINLQSYDAVAADLSLIRFDYTFDLDDSQLAVSGQRNGKHLTITIRNREETTRQVIQVPDKIYPSSAILLYPYLHGLQVGRQFNYEVYDAQTQRLEKVNQNITAYEESELFDGPAYKIRTRFKGQTVTTWVNADGLPLIEMSQGGIIISVIESQNIAQRYLSQAAFNKDDVLLEFSLIKIDPLGVPPEKVRSMTAEIKGVDRSIELPNNERQNCHRVDNEVTCHVSKFSNNSIIEHFSPLEISEALHRYLLPTFAISSEHPDIKSMARDITEGVHDEGRRIQALVNWMQQHIKREAVDVFTALDVLKGRRAECQGYAILFAAFARSLGIPTRVVNGIVYLPRFNGFLYHSWNESYIDNRWLAIDSIFNQIPADATHIKLLEGETLSDLLPLVNLIGKLTVQIISTEQLP
jgi:hypothetical protein